MGGTEELSGFIHGTVIGCHLCHKAVCEVLYLLDLSWWSVILWNVICHLNVKYCEQLSHEAVDHVDHGCPVLKYTKHRNHLFSVTTLTVKLPLEWILALLFSPNISVWPRMCSFEWMGTNSHRHTPKPCAKPFQKCGGCYSHKRGSSSHF